MNAPLVVRPPPPAPSQPALVAPSGATATIDGDAIALRDPEGRVVARYDGATGELVLSTQGTLRLEASTVRIDTDAFEVSAVTSRFDVERWELAARQLYERAGDAFRTAEGIVETRAHRCRTLVARGFELIAERSSIMSRQDTRIDGKRVLLG